MKKFLSFVAMTLAMAVAAIAVTDVPAAGWPWSGANNPTITITDGGSAFIRGGEAGTVLTFNQAHFGTPAYNEGINAVTAFGAICDNSTDNSAALQACMNASAGAGADCFLPACPLAYVVAHPVIPPSNSTFRGTPGTTIRSTISPGSPIAQTNSLFYAQSVGTGNVGTLASILSSGATSASCTLTNKPAVNDYLPISNSLSQQTFIIRSVSGGAADGGAGTYTIGLDRPAGLTFPVSGTIVSELSSVPTNIHLKGNGTVLTGTGARFAELVTCFECSEEDFVVNSSGGVVSDVNFGFDIGGFKDIQTGLSIEATGSSSIVYGTTLEACDSCLTTKSTAQNVGGVSFANLDGIVSNLTELHSKGAGQYDYAVGTDASLGCFHCKMANDTGESSANWGLVLNGSTDFQGVALSFTNCGNTGVLFNASGISESDFEGLTVDGCATGFNGGSGNTGTIVRGLHAVGITTSILTTASDITLDGAYIAGVSATMNALTFTGGNYANVTGLDYTHTDISNAANFLGVARGFLSSSRINIASTSEAIQVSAGTVSVRSTVTAGSASGTTGIAIGAGTVVQVASDVDVSSTSTPFSNSGTLLLGESAGSTPISITDGGAATLGWLSSIPQEVDIAGNGGTVNVPAIAGWAADFRNCASGNVTVQPTGAPGHGFTLVQHQCVHAVVVPNLSGGTFDVVMSTLNQNTSCGCPS